MLLRLLRNRWTVLAAAVALGGLFIYASVYKIHSPGEFAGTIYNYHILPVPLLANLLAVTLPWIELFAGLALLTGILRREGALICSGLLVVFMIAVASAMIRGYQIDCGCFSPSGAGREVALKVIVQDIGMLLLGALVLWGTQKGDAPEAAPS